MVILLKKFDGKPLPFKGVANLDVELKDKAGNGKVFDTVWKFKQRGQSGAWISDLFPHVAEMADELCIIKSMTSRFPEHTSANFFLHSGSGLQ